MSKSSEIIQQIQKVLTTQSSFYEEKLKTTRGLSSPSGQMTLLVPIQTSSRSLGGKHFLVKVFDRKLAHRHLLWFLLFRGITVLEWFILYQKFESQRKGEIKVSDACLLGVLTLSSNTRKRLEHWSSRTRPIHKMLKSRKPTSGSEFQGKDNLLELVMHEMKIPQKGETKSLLYNVQTITPRNLKPSEPNRIGVGYRDKGSMSPVDSIEPIVDSALFLEETVGIEDLFELWIKISRSFTNLSP